MGGPMTTLRRNSAGRIVADYAALVPDEFEEALAEQAIVYFPLGAIEWHNTHLPLNTDCVIAEGLCRRLAEETGGLILPTHPWATACTFRNTGPYPFDAAVGTLALFDAELYEQVLRAVLRGVLANGFKRLVLLPGHVGKDDRDVQERIAQEINAGDQARMLYAYAYGIAREREIYENGASGGDHAGHWETLMVYGIQPELVRQGKTYVHFDYGHALTGEESEETGRRHVDTMCQALLAEVRSFFGE